MLILSYLLILFASVCFMMLTFSWLNFKSVPTKLMKLIYYFWLVLVANFFLSAVTSVSERIEILVIGVLIWPVLMYVLHLIMQEFKPEIKVYKSVITLVIAGQLTTLILALLRGLGYAEFNLIVLSAPSIGTTAIFGFSSAYQYLTLDRKRKMLSMEKIFLVLFLTVVLHILDWPFLRPIPEFAMWGYTFFILQLVGFASNLPALALQLEGSRQRMVLEQLIEERTQQLIQQSKLSALGEMAAGVAHEINNPLAIIVARTEQLLKKSQGPEVDINLIQDGLKNIEITAFRISHIIKALRDFSRTDKNALSQVVVLKEVIEEVLLFCKERFHNNGIELLIEGDYEVSVLSHGPQLSQVFLNLLNNAFDAVENCSEKWVKILACKNGDILQVFISDSGPGIPDEVINKIMQPFYTTKEIGRGTGLGLSISKGIVESHQGRLYLDESRKHTTFVIELPSV